MTLAEHEAITDRAHLDTITELEAFTVRDGRRELRGEVRRFIKNIGLRGSAKVQAAARAALDKLAQR